MASDLNVWTGVCRLTKDPELRSLPSGTSVCKLRVAYSTSKKNNATGEYEDQPNYIDVTVWGKQGENAARYLSKGSRIGVVGELEYREWQKDGQTRSTYEINARTIQFLTPKSEQQGGAPAQSTAPATPPVTAAPAPADDDDIPF